MPEGVGIRVSGQDGGRAFEGIATVIGLGGMFCRTQNKIPTGTVLDLLLTYAADSFKVQCTVRHANEQGMGIEFTGFTPEDKQKLEKILLRLQV